MQIASGLRPRRPWAPVTRLPILASRDKEPQPGWSCRVAIVLMMPAHSLTHSFTHPTTYYPYPTTALNAWPSTVSKHYMHGRNSGEPLQTLPYRLSRPMAQGESTQNKVISPPSNDTSSSPMARPRPSVLFAASTLYRAKKSRAGQT